MEWAKNNAGLIACILAVILAFSFGRWSVRESTHEIVIDNSMAVEADRSVRYMVVYRNLTTETETDQKTSKTTIEIIKPDGTQIKIEKDENESHTREKVAETEQKTDAEIDTKVKIEYQQQIVEKEKIVPVDKDWRLSLRGGVVLPEITSGKPWVVGAEVDRRILGPISMGLWADTRGAGGVAVTFDF